MLVVLFESILLAIGGGFAGWFAGHLLIGAGRAVRDRATRALKSGSCSLLPDLS